MVALLSVMRLSSSQGSELTYLRRQNNYSGGRCSLLYAESDDGGFHRFDQGPSLYVYYAVLRLLVPCLG